MRKPAASVSVSPPPTSSPTRSHPLSVGAALLALYLVWGSTYLGIRIAIETLPPLLMASFRFLVAGALLYCWSAWRSPPEQRRKVPGAWRAAFIVGGALLLCGNGGVAWAEQYVPSGLAALLIATAPVWIAVFDRAFWGAPLHPLTGLGIAIGMAGLLLLLWPVGSFALNIAGVAVLLGAALAWSLGSLYARGAPLPAAAGLGTGMEMMAGGVLLAAAGIVDGELGRLDLGGISSASLAALAYLTIFGSLLAFSCYTWLLRRANTSMVATYAYVNPVVAVYLGSVFAGEALTLRTAVAAAIIVVGVAIIVGTRSLAQARQA